MRPLNVALLVSVARGRRRSTCSARAQGGNFNESLWQLRQTLLFPVRALLLLRAFDGTDVELKNIARRRSSSSASSRR